MYNKTATRIVFFIFFICSIPLATAQTVLQIGDNIPNIINGSSVLELDSATKALLLTRVANTAAIVNKVNGMMIYDISANCVKSYENGTWTACLSNTDPSPGSTNYIQNQNASAQSANIYINGGIRSATINTMGESHLAYAAFVDSDPNVVRTLKIGDKGIAVLGGIKTDDLNITGTATGKTVTAGDESTNLATTAFVKANAAPLSGSTNYIQNQNTVVQTANMNISGKGTFAGGVNVLDVNHGLKAVIGEGITLFTFNVPAALKIQESTGYATFSNSVTNAAPTAGSTNTIDFGVNNLASTSAVSGTFTLTNLRNGGAYTLVATATTNSSSAVFTATGFTIIYMGTVAMTSGKQHIYSFIVMNNIVYVSMATQN